MDRRISISLQNIDGANYRIIQTIKHDDANKPACHAITTDFQPIIYQTTFIFLPCQKLKFDITCRLVVKIIPGEKQ